MGSSTGSGAKLPVGWNGLAGGVVRDGQGGLSAQFVPQLARIVGVARQRAVDQPRTLVVEVQDVPVTVDPARHS